MQIHATHCVQATVQQAEALMILPHPAEEFPETGTDLVFSLILQLKRSMFHWIELMIKPR